MTRLRVLALAALLVSRAGAHSLDPALLDLRETPDGAVHVTWKTAPSRAAGARVEPVLPRTCRPTTPAVADDEGASVTVRWTADCGALVGQRIGVAGLGAARTDALVRIALADGRLVRRVVRASEPMLVIPARPRRLAVVVDYGRLGIEHILTGPDHLLFVLGLLLLVVTPRRVVQTVTAFTAGHSLTLGAAVLGVIRLPPAFAELLIAASVFALATELGRVPVRPTLMRRFPWAMAGLFGLLHGLGFAGTLQAAGLPAGDVPLALASFNLGVEIGQIGFIAAALGVRAALARRAAWPRWVASAPTYAIGSLAAYWCFERAALLLR